MEAPDWSTIWERTKDLDLELDGVKTDEPISIALDSSGIKVSNSGDWIRKKWKVKRGYLKIHLAVDSQSKQAVSMQVTEETVSDGSQTEPLVQEAIVKNNVGRVYGDGAYDSRANFNLITSNGIDPVIKVRKNASRKAKGSYARKQAAVAQQTDFDGWKEEKHYGVDPPKGERFLAHPRDDVSQGLSPFPPLIPFVHRQAIARGTRTV